MSKNDNQKKPLPIFPTNYAINYTLFIDANKEKPNRVSFQINKPDDYHADIVNMLCILGRLEGVDKIDKPDKGRTKAIEYLQKLSGSLIKRFQIDYEGIYDESIKSKKPTPKKKAKPKPKAKVIKLKP